MDLHLHGKTALITGSSARTGFASAAALARQGTSIVLNGPNSARLADAQQRLLYLLPTASVRTSAADVSTAQGAHDLTTAPTDRGVPLLHKQADTHTWLSPPPAHQRVFDR